MHHFSYRSGVLHADAFLSKCSPDGFHLLYEFNYVGGGNIHQIGLFALPAKHSRCRQDRE